MLLEHMLSDIPAVLNKHSSPDLTDTYKYLTSSRLIMRRLNFEYDTELEKVFFSSCYKDTPKVLVNYANINGDDDRKIANRLCELNYIDKDMLAESLVFYTKCIDILGMHYLVRQRLCELNSSTWIYKAIEDCYLEDHSDLAEALAQCNDKDALKYQLAYLQKYPINRDIARSVRDKLSQWLEANYHDNGNPQT